jgi:hypothetical protein
LNISVPIRDRRFTEMRGSLIVRAFVALGALAVTLGLTHAEGVQLAFWDFNDNDATVDGGVNGGTLSLIGGVTNPTGTFAWFSFRFRLSKQGLPDHELP